MRRGVRCGIRGAGNDNGMKKAAQGQQVSLAVAPRDHGGRAIYRAWAVRLALLVFCVLRSAFSVAFAASLPQVSATVDKAEVTVGDPIQYTIHVVADTNLSWAGPDAKADVSPFEVRDYKPGVLRQEDGKSVTDITFTVALYKAGSFKLDKLTVSYRDAAGKDLTVPVPPVTVTVKSVLPPGAQDIKDIRGPKPVAAGPAQWIVGIVLGLLIAALLFWAVYWYTHRKPKAAAAPPPVPLTDWEIAVRDLEALLERALVSPEDIKAHYVSISEIVRTYLVSRYRISAMEETTSIIFYHLRRHPEARNEASDFRDLLAACDLVKFAKYRPDADEAFRSADWARKVVLLSRRPAAAPPATSEEPALAQAEGSIAGGGNAVGGAP